MDWKQEKPQTLARLALCVIIAAAVYAAADKFGDKLPLPERCRPWLEKNKVQAIAVLAAVLFGLSLIILPSPRQAQTVPPPEPHESCCDPCDGCERTD